MKKKQLIYSRRERKEGGTTDGLNFPFLLNCRILKFPVAFLGRGGGGGRKLQPEVVFSITKIY